MSARSLLAAAGLAATLIFAPQTPAQAASEAPVRADSFSLESLMSRDPVIAAQQRRYMAQEARAQAFDRQQENPQRILTAVDEAATTLAFMSRSNNGTSPRFVLGGAGNLLEIYHNAFDRVIGTPSEKTMQDMYAGIERSLIIIHRQAINDMKAQAPVKEARRLGK